MKKYRETELKQFGVGISLYFKFIKFMIAMFTIISILSIPAFTFYLWANDLSATDINLKNGLATTTIGNLGACKTNFDNG
jgi:hypothetical protein